MFDEKNLLASKTFWGATVQVLAAAAALFGYQFAPEEQQQLVLHITAIAAGVGYIVTLAGRIRASKRIK